MVPKPGKSYECQKCGTVVKTPSDYVPKTVADYKPYRTYIRYPALKTITTAFRVLGWIIIFLACISFFISLILAVKYNSGSLLLTSIVSLIVGGFWALICFAFAESIGVSIDIEENTRTAKDILELIKKYPRPFQ
jgi:cellulose synthase/poly-beta-1,6-N-acetylglucosamine synthase-like glycosyltransferase